MRVDRASVEGHRTGERPAAHLTLDPAQSLRQRRAESRRGELGRAPAQERRGRARSYAPEQPFVGKPSLPTKLHRRPCGVPDSDEDHAGGDRKHPGPLDPESEAAPKSDH
jgi:hypothetical protein